MFITAFLFLIQTLFDLFIYIVLLRFLLQTLHIDHFNPLSQFTLKFTQWIVKPLQKIIPEVKGIDLAIIVLLLCLEMLKIMVLVAIQFSAWPNFFGLLLLSIAGLLGKLLTFYFYAILIRVILSWVTPTHPNAIFFAFHQLTEPVLRPFRRLIPVIGGFDLSPLLALILTQFLSLLIISPLTQFAMSFL